MPFVVFQCRVILHGRQFLRALARHPANPAESVQAVCHDFRIRQPLDTDIVNASKNFSLFSVIGRVRFPINSDGDNVPAYGLSQLAIAGCLQRLADRAQ